MTISFKFSRYCFVSVSVAVMLALSGCASNSVENVDTSNDTGSAVAGIDYRDFEKAAKESVGKMIASGAVTNPNGGRYVLMISRIQNKTLQRFDTDQLTAKISEDLLQSGKVVTTMAQSGSGGVDQAIYQTRDDIRGNAEFNQSRAPAQGQLIAADLSLSGKIIQRNVAMPDGKQQIEYYIQLYLADIKTGLALWQGETRLVKRASGKMEAW